MPKKYIIKKNNFLSTETEGYFNCFYRGFRQPENPDFINVLKNTYNSEQESELIKAKNEIVNIITKDLPAVIKDIGFESYTIICVPRAKSLTSYADSQLYFIKAVGDAADLLKNATNGAECIHRHTDTKTTHLKSDTGRVTRTGKEDINTGDAPYPGITAKTCSIDSSLIKDKNIVLIDDIYTKTCNIDEDCIQALYDCGAKKVILYTIAYTQRER